MKKIVLTIAIFCTACSNLPRNEAVPPEEISEAKILGDENIRYFPWEKRSLNKLKQLAFNNINNNETSLKKIGQSYLSISGGGDNGAFGAGLLCGWTNAGTRPSFDLVTGISTGALIATFAYLGSDYDYVLRDVYTDVNQKDILIQKGLYGLLFGDSFANTKPLSELIEKHITKAIIDDVAYEYTIKKRMLWVATTDLDAGRPVIWDMGAIASKGSDEALDLFRKVLLASASIPVAFNPILFDVNVNNNNYQELHVDGGATAEVFLYPTAISKAFVPTQYNSISNAYIIRNARIGVKPIETKRNTIEIASRSIDQLIQTQAYGNLNEIYLTALRDQVNFNLAYIADDFKSVEKAPFDKAYMSALFDYGYMLSKNGYPWEKSPPGYFNSIVQDLNNHIAKDTVLLDRRAQRKK